MPSPSAVAVQGVGYSPALMAVQGFGEDVANLIQGPDAQVEEPDPYEEVQQRLAKRRRIQRQNSMIVQMVIAAIVSGAIR